MATSLNLGVITAEVVQKDIKNVHLSVYPPGELNRCAVVGFAKQSYALVLPGPFLAARAWRAIRFVRGEAFKPSFDAAWRPRKPSVSQAPAGE